MSSQDTSVGSTNPELVDSCREFLNRYCSEEIATLAQHFPKEQRSLFVPWGDLFQYDPDLAEDFLDQPAQIRQYLEAALAEYELPIDVGLEKANIRISEMPKDVQYQVGGYRASDVGSFAAIDGQVQKASDVKPVPEEIAFECQRCGTLTTVPQTGTEFQEPHECEGCDRQGPFEIHVEHSSFRDHQLVRLQQPPEQTKGGRGSTVDVHLENDIVESCEPGDRVTVLGDLSVEEPSDGDMAFTPYLEGRNVEIEETDYEEVDLSQEDRERVEAIANGEKGDPYDLLVQSLAPKHRGDEDIKKALALQLFGGTRVEYPDGAVDRGDAHILLLGEPGTGKSTLLRAVENLAPRSVYTSGKGASAAGMTASAVRDDFGESEWALEAGALVMANKGIACVDEIDKVDEDAVSSMHEALANQTVSVSKAGINATLPAQTSLLAAGNPKYGRFNPNEPYADQIDLGPTLLSRFDLWFMVSDRPDEEEDREIASHMVDARRAAIAHKEGEEESADVDIEPAIGEDLLRKYIAHAKQTVQPRITDDTVREKLVDWYTNLRLANGAGDDTPIPVTARKLEAVERLAEASARIRLSQSVELEDAKRAVRLVERSMRDVGVDPDSEELDVDIIETGQSQSQRDRVQAVCDILREETQDGYVEQEEVLDIAEEEGFNRSKVEHTIKDLKKKGEIYYGGEEKIHWVG